MLVAASGCQPETPPVGCGFGTSHLHAHAEGGQFDDLALVPTESGAALLFSDRSGTYVRRLDSDGRAEGASRLLGAPCAGGLAAVVHGGTLLVACSRPADPDRDREGVVSIAQVEDDTVRVLDRVGGVGAESRGVELVGDDARVFVGWSDADGLSSRARVAELRGDGFAPPRALSSGPMLASAPSLLLWDGALWAAWTESWLDAGGRSSGHVFIQREGEPPVPSLRLNELRPPVRLGADADGPFVALRDRRPRTAEHQRAIVGRLDERLRLTADGLRSPGRADDPSAAPALLRCGEHLFSIATRRSRRQVTMVSVRRLRADLRPAEAEHQIYEYHARFPQAVAACVDDQVLVAVGEQRSRVSPVPRLRTYILRCEPGLAHERTPGIEGQVLRERGAGP